MTNDEWWLWGPLELPQPMTNEEFYATGEEACACFMEKEERKYNDKLSKI